MARKWILGTLFLLPVVFLLAFFTSFFSFLPALLSDGLTRPFWENLVPGKEDFLPRMLAGGWMAAGPFVIAIAVGCWVLLVRRENNLLIRRVAERSEKIRDWLKTWADRRDSGLSEEHDEAATLAGKILARLDRLLETKEPKRRTLLYVLKLVCWYWPHASKITVYSTDEDEIDPPIDAWPVPADCTPTLSKENKKVLGGALAFCSLFTDGAIATVGHVYFRNSVVYWPFFTIVLGVLVGGILTLVAVSLLGLWTGLVLSSLAVAGILAVPTAIVWQMITKGRRLTEPPLQQA